MPFYLIYIDDYGNTRGNLIDPQQPVFMLTASFVRADDGTWGRLERALTDLIHTVSQEVKAGKEIRLHAVDLYQRKGLIRTGNISVERMGEWFEHVLSVARLHDVKYLFSPVNKKDLARAIERMMSVYKETKPEVYEKLSAGDTDPGRLKLPLYQANFPFFLAEIDRTLKTLDSYGIIIVDQQKLDGSSNEPFEVVDIYRALRSKGMLERIVEVPIYKDSRRHTLIALPDFAGYVIGGVLSDLATGKTRPFLANWQTDYIDPHTITPEPITISEPPTSDVNAIYTKLNFGLIFHIAMNDKEIDLVKGVSLIESVLKIEVEPN